MNRKIILVLLVELALVILEVIRNALNRNWQRALTLIYKVNHVVTDCQVRER